MPKIYERLFKLRTIAIFLLPTVYFLIARHFRVLLGDLSLRSSDPEYIYFMSGLNLSEGTLELAHIDNPGTPLQILMALLFRIIWLVRGAPSVYIEDILAHPDFYLSVTSFTIAGLTTVLLLYAGKKIFESTGSVLLALLFQTAPFLPLIWFDLIGRVAPELMMPFPVILLMVMTVSILKQNSPVTNKQVLLLSLIAAFGLAIKLTFLPIWILPFFLVGDWKQKIRFILLSLLGFFIIAFPVTLQWDIFWNWIKSLFLHSGQYGAGESNILDPVALKSHIHELFNLEKYFFILFSILIVTLLAYLGWFRKKVEKKLSLVSLAVILVIVIQLVMVGKHFAHRYFIPVLMLSPLMIFLIFEMFKKIAPGENTTKSIQWAVLVLLLIQFRNNVHWFPVKNEAMGTDIVNRKMTLDVVKQLDKNSYKIIATQNYGCPFIEYILAYSQVWAKHEKRLEYTPVLNKLYPNVYNHFTWDNTLKYWGQAFDAGQIISSGKKIYLYTERDDEALYEKTLTKLHEESKTPFIAQKKVLFTNAANKETIYELTFSHPEK
ncbi:MAG TPA: hypothetical protein PLU49_09900 [Saprospiraceae bacterium]|nr:hypothetical protein [Saprospiraceae bacterium]